MSERDYQCTDFSEDKKLVKAEEAYKSALEDFISKEVMYAVENVFKNMEVSYSFTKNSVCLHVSSEEYDFGKQIKFTDIQSEIFDKEGIEMFEIPQSVANNYKKIRKFLEVVIPNLEKE